MIFTIQAVGDTVGSGIYPSESRFFKYVLGAEIVRLDKRCGDRLAFRVRECPGGQGFDRLGHVPPTLIGRRNAVTDFHFAGFIGNPLESDQPDAAIFLAQMDQPVGEPGKLLLRLALHAVHFHLHGIAGPAGIKFRVEGDIEQAREGINRFQTNGKLECSQGNEMQTGGFEQGISSRNSDHLDFTTACSEPQHKHAALTKKSHLI